jgi:hypothetical protein
VQDKKWVTRGLRRLGGKVVIVLATGPKGCGFKSSRGDGFLRAIKIRSTPSFRWEIKPVCKNHLQVSTEILQG